MKQTCKIILFAVIFIFLYSPSLWAANRYWVGGSGNWSDAANHWATSSGGASGAGNLPDSGDRARFNGNSGGGTCTIDIAVDIRGLLMDAGNTTLISQGSNTIIVGNQDVILTAGVFNGGSGTITVNDRFTLEGAAFNNTSATLSISNIFLMTSGTFNASSSTIDAGNDIRIQGGTFNAQTSTIQASGDFEFTGGSLDMGTSTLVFDDSGNGAWGTGGGSYYNVTINKNANNNRVTISGGTPTVTAALTLINGLLRGGTVNAQGDIALASTFDGNTASLVINGTGDQALTGGGSASSGDFLPIDINKVSGTLTLASIIRTERDWTYTTGTVDAGASTIVFAGGITITGDMTFNNVTFNDNSTFTIVGGTTITVSGDLALTDDMVDTGTINAEADVTVGAGFRGGTATLALTGTGDQAITSSGGQITDTFNINKASGTVTISGDTTFSTLNLQSGTLDFNGGSTYTFATTGSGITTSASTTLNFQGSSGNLVTLVRSGGGDWMLNVNASGSYIADFVDASYSDASAGRLIYATNSTDSGNNTNWFFIDDIVFTTVAQSLNINEISAVMTIELRNSDGTPINVGEDITIDLSTTSAGGEFSASAFPFVSINSIIIPDGASTVNFYYRDSQGGSPVITAAENPDKRWTDAEQTQIITSNLGSFLVEASTSQISGISFTVTVTALNGLGGVLTSYSDGAALTVDYVFPASGTQLLEGDTAIASFTNGVATTSVRYDDAGTITITATDDQALGVTGTSANIVVRPSAFTVVPDALTQQAGANFTLTITAINSSSGTTPNYSGAITLSVNYIDPATGTKNVSIAAIAAADFTNGVAEITNINYSDAGTITTTAIDSTFVSGVDITGTSENILFRPAKFSVVLSRIPASRDFYYTNEAFDITVTAQNVNNETTPNYRGTISITNTFNIGLFAAYTFLANNNGEHVFENVSAQEEGSFTVAIVDTSFAQVNGESDTITIKIGQITVISTSGPVGSLDVIVRITDSNGYIIISDDSTTFIVTLNEAINDNDSATSTVTSVSATMTDGVAVIIVSDTEAETVTITPISTPVLTAVAGTARFGTISGTGIGVQLWREIRKPAEYEDWNQ